MMWCIGILNRISFNRFPLCKIALHWFSTGKRTAWDCKRRWTQAKLVRQTWAVNGNACRICYLYLLTFKRTFAAAHTQLSCSEVYFALCHDAMALEESWKPTQRESVTGHSHNRSSDQSWRGLCSWCLFKSSAVTWLVSF